MKTSAYVEFEGQVSAYGRKKGVVVRAWGCAKLRAKCRSILAFRFQKGVIDSRLLKSFQNRQQFQ
jgi:hypothetical protein